MGDRANIVIRSNWPDDLGEREAIFLYSHWGGYELPETLRAALSRGRERWNDEPYLARIVFNEMTRGQEMEMTGFGLSTRPCDNEYDLLVLHNERVYILSERSYEEHGFGALLLAPSLSFEEYVSVPERTWENLKTV